MPGREKELQVTWSNKEWYLAKILYPNVIVGHGLQAAGQDKEVQEDGWQCGGDAKYKSGRTQESSSKNMK